MTEPTTPVPRPGRHGGGDATSQGVDAAEVDEQSATVTRLEESVVGPGAGEGEVVKVTAPIQRQGEPVTQHPTLRDSDHGGDVERH